MMETLIALHNSFVGKGMNESVWVSRTWSGVKGYSYYIHENNYGYLIWDIQKWLRQVKDVNVWVKPYEKGWSCCVDRGLLCDEYRLHHEIDFEEALIIGLEQSLYYVN